MPNGPPQNKFIGGEYRRTLDLRFRVSIPQEMLEALGIANGDCLLTKEAPGALSLWPLDPWQSQFAARMTLIHQKFAAGRLNERLTTLQTLGRLVATRQRQLQLGGRGRLLIPEGFREFLGAEPGGDVMVVGAAVCVEIWRPDAWTAQLAAELPRFHEIYDELSQ